MHVQFGDEDAESMTSRPPPLFRQRRFWALAIPCAFTLGMLIFAIEHLIRDPNEVRQTSSARAPVLTLQHVHGIRVIICCTSSCSAPSPSKATRSILASVIQQITSDIVCPIMATNHLSTCCLHPLLMLSI